MAPPAKENEKADTSALPSDFLIGYAPGQPAEILQPGQAKLVKAGSDIVMEVHYMADGMATPSQARGTVFAKEPPKQRCRHSRRAMGRSRFRQTIRTTEWTPV